MEAQDAAVVAQVLAGDRDAYRVLVERHSRTIFKLGYRMMGNETDAEDVVQETLLRAYAKLSGFQFEASFRTWLCRIATNHCLDVIAKRKHETEMPKVMDEETEEVRDVDIAAEAPSPERVLLSTEARQALRTAMDSLSAVERAAFVLRHFERCSIREISGTLRVSEGAAKQSICRAIRKIRKDLGPLVMGAAG